MSKFSHVMAGDKVLIGTRSKSFEKQVVSIGRTMITVEGGTKYSIKTGDKFGSSMSWLVGKVA